MSISFNTRYKKYKSKHDQLQKINVSTFMLYLSDISAECVTLKWIVGEYGSAGVWVNGILLPISCDAEMRDVEGVASDPKKDDAAGGEAVSSSSVDDKDTTCCWFLGGSAARFLVLGIDIVGKSISSSFSSSKSAARLNTTVFGKVKKSGCQLNQYLNVCHNNKHHDIVRRKCEPNDRKYRYQLNINMIEFQS